MNCLNSQVDRALADMQKEPLKKVTKLIADGISQNLHYYLYQQNTDNTITQSMVSSQCWFYFYNTIKNK